MTRIAHISDTHGYLTRLPPDIDLIVHSGDFLPNRSYNRIIEQAFQPQWIEDNTENLKRWIGDKPFLITHGNHDFIDSVPYLQSIGVDAHRLDDRRYVHDRITFHGFPYVPYFTGIWNYETPPMDLTTRTEAIDLEGVDFLVAHSPIYGILDMNRSGTRCGSKPMRKFLQTSKHVPSYYLTGHIHESHGYKHWSRDIQVYNSATICQVIEI